MSSYATIDDFVAYYSDTEGVDVSTPDRSSLQADPERIRRALIAASNYVNSQVGARYPVPLVSWDTELVRAVCAIAMHNNLDTRLRETTVARFDFSVQWLKDVRDRKASLMSANGAPLAERSIDANAPIMSLNCV